MPTLYGAGAYTGSNPIGGGAGYQSEYSEGLAHFIVESWAELRSAAKEAKSDQEVWVPTTLTMPSGDDHPTFNPGVILASNLSGKLRNPYTVGGTGNYMSPILYASSNCVISGLILEGPGCFASTSDSRTNAAIRCVNGAKRVEVENCELVNFYQGGVYIYGGAPSPWNDDSSTGRHWIHHCRIHGMQRHGFGYGVQLEGGGSALIEACDFYDCRHFICGGYSNSYEIRYCTIDDSWYRSMGTGAPTGNTQLDAHGHGDTTAGYAGYHILIHHNILSANNTMYPPGKGSIGIRGIPRYECRVYNNWTKKTYKSGLHTETVNNPGGLAYLAGPAGGSWGGDTDLAKHNMYVYDNWYGAEPPPGDDQPEPPIEVNTPDIQVVSLVAPEVAVGDTYTVTATVENKGTGAGSADIEIGYISGATKRPLVTLPVDLEAGESAEVVRQAEATTAGDWTFYCGDLRAVLKVVVPPPPAPKFELSTVSASVIENSVSILAIVKNTGNADGTAFARLGDSARSVAIPAGGEVQVVFGLGVVSVAPA